MQDPNYSRGNQIATSLDVLHAAMTSARKHTSAANEKACHPLYQMALYKLRRGRTGGNPLTALFPAGITPWGRRWEYRKLNPVSWQTAL